MVKTENKMRPPIVAVLGHVDHGKTTLLDYIRKTKIAPGEQGGITQSIGAYQIKKPSKITFIDTPGHEAFSAMRSRGVEAADLALLVIAADESIMPQTKESIKYIKTAKIPFIVVINKIDIPGVDPEKVKKDLLREGVACEGYGGEIVAVEVSAKTGQGIEELLEIIELLSQMEEIKADPNAPLEGVVIESGLDKRKGPVATVLVKNGTLKVRDNIFANGYKGRVKAIYNEFGKQIKNAKPSQPAQILGFSNIIPIGARIKREGENKGEDEKQQKPLNLAEKISKTKGEAIKIVLKADTQGSLESVLNTLPADVKVLRGEVGDITEKDIVFASAGKAAVIGYRVEANRRIKDLAQEENVVLRTYEIIYKLIEEIEDVVEELTYIPKEIVLGRAKVLAKFVINDLVVAGVRIEEGRFKTGDKVKVERDAKTLRGEVLSIKQQKTQVNEAKKGGEYGIGIKGNIDFAKGDVIIAYNIE